MLPVEDRRELMRGAGERGMVDDVVDALVSEPDLALACLQTLEELLTRARSHAGGSVRFAGDDATRDANRLGLVGPELLVVGRVLERLFRRQVLEVVQRGVDVA